MSNPVTLPIAQIVPCTEAEGPGRRFAVWFQGCPLRCPGCCNPEMLPFDGGTATPIDDVVGQLGRAVETHGVEGVTLLGGEPFAHAAAACGFARQIRELGLSVMIFSGYEIEELRTMREPAVHELLARTDLLVDGPYLRDQPDTDRRWIGSRNQRIHFLTERYRADDPCWRQSDTLEIRLRNGEVIVNGFPAQRAVGLWRRLDVPAKR
jgi:anaerobic ribonucleoside-triphosphate reductase activating protein